MENLIPFLSEIAKGAGDITLKYFQSALDIDHKADESPVTAADREAEEYLRREIQRKFPEDEILGEEFGGTTEAGKRRRWILDPLDGTRSFVRGVPLYGVLIGVEYEGEIIAGAVNLPALDDLVVAQRGSGCWWNGKPAHVSSTEKLEQSLVLTTDVANNYRYGKGNAWELLSARAQMVRTWGDCYGHVLVATGRADVMVDPIVEIWDIAAVKIIVEEAGGRFTDYAGHPTIYNRCAISTNGLLHEQVLQLVHPLE